MTTFCAFIIGMHNIALVLSISPTLCIWLLCSRTHSHTSGMFSVWLVLATKLAICASVELLKSFTDGFEMLADWFSLPNSNNTVNRVLFLSCEIDWKSKGRNKSTRWLQNEIINLPVDLILLVLVCCLLLSLNGSSFVQLTVLDLASPESSRDDSAIRKRYKSSWRKCALLLKSWKDSMMQTKQGDRFISSLTFDFMALVGSKFITFVKIIN